MRTQAADLAAGRKAQSTDDLDAIEEELESGEAAVAAPEKRYGFLAVCAGEGLAAVFRDLTVDRIVSGGQTMNPSTEAILQEVNRTPSEVVFILPNNKNIIMAAQQCVGLTEKEVIVVPTNTVSQGISAMMAVDPEEADPQVILAAMTEAAEIGTRKVITDHATVGVVVTTDGTVTDIPREDYREAEERVIRELQEIGKPFLVLMNSAQPESARAAAAAEEIREKYGVGCRCVNCLALTEEDIKAITSVLTPEQIKVADGLQKLASTKLAEWGNEASMAVYGYRKFMEAHYWPIKTA